MKKKTNFKILFPTGYQYEDVSNDNIDMHVILETGEVYFAMVFTIANVQYFMEKDKEPYFWSNDMLIVKDLSEATLMTSIALLLDQIAPDDAFSKIGRIGENDLYMGVTFDDLENMGGMFLSD